MLYPHPKRETNGAMCCREVAKAVKLRRAKTIVVAPNIEQIESEGGLDDLLGNILSQAEAAGLPVVFALSRKKMGQVRKPHSICKPQTLNSGWAPALMKRGDCISITTDSVQRTRSV